jgi:hypothetical protein
MKFMAIVRAHERAHEHSIAVTDDECCYSRQQSLINLVCMKNNSKSRMNENECCYSRHQSLSPHTFAVSMSPRTHKQPSLFESPPALARKKKNGTKHLAASNRLQMAGVSRHLHLLPLPYDNVITFHLLLFLVPC